MSTTEAQTRADEVPELSVVIPVHDEADNILPLLQEIETALSGRVRFEVVVVDDGSRDETPARLSEALSAMPFLRVLRHERQAGQSRAIWNGVRAARAPWIATLDGDGQNDPGDIPKLLAERERLGGEVGLLAGWRVHRRDSAWKRFGSRLANAVRGWLLKDRTPDTGCGLKLFRRDAFLELPYFDHMHRFLPALFQREGWLTRSIPVGHRPRRAGRSHYGNLRRLWVGLADLGGVAWLLRRRRRTAVHEIGPSRIGEHP
ncbi:MAG: dolichol-phosphate mannosyltransferase [Lysobacterales bacterium]|nr:MAG: dolichol-phosphate mannosyltransferase [Xanthomonadales bacterium]